MINAPAFDADEFETLEREICAKRSVAQQGIDPNFLALRAEAKLTLPSGIARLSVPRVQAPDIKVFGDSRWRSSKRIPH